MDIEKLMECLDIICDVLEHIRGSAPDIVLAPAEEAIATACAILAGVDE